MNQQIILTANKKIEWVISTLFMNNFSEVKQGTPNGYEWEWGAGWIMTNNSWKSYFILWTLDLSVLPLIIKIFILQQFNGPLTTDIFVLLILKNTMTRECVFVECSGVTLENYNYCCKHHIHTVSIILIMSSVLKHFLSGTNWVQLDRYN